MRTAPGASLSRVKADLQKVAATHPGVHVTGTAALRSDEAKQREILVWVNRVLAGLIFIFTAIAAVNTLAMIALSRGRELALLRLVGATPRQVARMARWEAGLVVIVGIGLGAAIAAATLVPFSRALTGSPIPDVDPRLLAGILEAPPCSASSPACCPRASRCARGRSTRSDSGTSQAVALDSSRLVERHDTPIATRTGIAGQWAIEARMAFNPRRLLRRPVHR